MPITRTPPAPTPPPHPPIFKNTSSPTSPENRLYQVSLLTEMQLLTNIHVTQQHNLGFFIFKSTLAYILSNVYINEIHARQCLYIMSICFREGIPIISEGILHV